MSLFGIEIKVIEDASIPPNMIWITDKEAWYAAGAGGGKTNTLWDLAKRLNDGVLHPDDAHNALIYNIMNADYEVTYGPGYMQIDRTPYMEQKKESYFLQAIEQIVSMHEKKASDYTDSGEFDNFIESANSADIETYQAIENLIGTKEARIRVLRKKEKRDNAIPTNEPLLDSYLDRAVYAIISYAHELMLKDESAPELLKPEDIEAVCASCYHSEEAHFGASIVTCKCCAAGRFYGAITKSYD